MVAIISILLIYCAFIVVLRIGWIKAIRKESSGGSIPEEMISVIVPLRNEARNIKTLIDSLSELHYNNFEIILIDDHSEDQTLQLVNTMTNHKLTVLTNHGAGKKKAITTGVNAAKGSLIVTTDADCIVPPNWLKFFNHAFTDKKIKLAFGGVSLTGPRSFFFDLQAIEFSSLIGSGAATAALSIPTLCNGANLAYRKTAFEEANGYEGDFHIASGDDEFMMRKVRKLYPDGVRFIAGQDVVVQTAAPSTLRSFFQQRIRWAGKWRYNSSFFAKSLALFILVSQALFIWGFISLFVSFNPVVLTLLVIKAALEAGFLYPVARYLDQRWNWSAFVVLQLLYPFYVLFTGIISNFISPSWKDRKIKVNHSA